MFDAGESELCDLFAELMNMKSCKISCSMMMDNLTPGLQRDNDALKHFLTFKIKQISKLHKYQSKCYLLLLSNPLSKGYLKELLDAFGHWSSVAGSG